MKKIESLSNKVHYEKERNIIIKEYSQDRFKKLFGNQEITILQKLGFKLNIISKRKVEIENIKFEKFDDFNMSLQDLAGVSNALKSLHNTDATNLTTPGFKKTYYGFLLKGKGTKRGYFDKIEKYIAENAIAILTKGKQVLLHNDLSASNILKLGNKIKLIDFEFSGIGNPIFDLASFLTERTLSKEQISLFITCFDKDIDHQELMIVSAFLQIFWTRWALYKYHLTKNDTYKDIAAWKYKGYKRIIKRLFI